MIHADQRLLQQDLPARASKPVRIPVPKVIQVTAWIVMGLFIAAASFVLISRVAGSDFDLLGAYAQILPGQPWANAEEAGFRCGLYNNGNHYVEACSSSLETGIFSGISVSRSNNVIDTVIFSPRADALSLGEVALAFGVQPGDQQSSTNWIIGDHQVVVWLNPGRINYFHPVRVIYVYRALPDRVHG